MADKRPQSRRSGRSRKICVVTGARADYGLLRPVMTLLRSDPAFRLQIVAAGMHLAPEFGLTYREIEKDGFKIDAKIPMLHFGDSPVGIAKAMGAGTSGFADAFARLKPDLIILLGDRFELLAAAQAALVARLALAHIAGGDVTEGAFDEAIRHSITKMAHIHFTTNLDSARRVRQLGENPRRIHMVGSPGLDNLRQMRLLSPAELDERFRLSLGGRPYFLVTFHPATLDAQAPADQFEELLEALDLLGDGFGVVLTAANADTRGRPINRRAARYAAGRANAWFIPSAGQLGYLSLMKHAAAVVGNSSSGLYEAPSFAIPTINIGDRQKGRLRAASVLDCAPKARAIADTIRKGLKRDFRGVKNPYGNGRSAKKIVSLLRSVRDFSSLLPKRFFDLKT